jgi:hypothetical protein
MTDQPWLRNASGYVGKLNAVDSLSIGERDRTHGQDNSVTQKEEAPWDQRTDLSREI